MNFEKGYIYHLFNQGNNRQKLFYNIDNYLFFLEKIKFYISPYADIFAWCLMPNHFHLMIFINEIEMLVKKPGNDILNKKRTLNDSIAIMLRSYTRAIHNQNESSGALFREATKAECINCPKGLTKNWFERTGITFIILPEPEKQYPQLCFNYIHQNPVVAGLVKKSEDWEFSSAQDYAGLRNGNLVNIEKAREYLIF